MKLRLFGSGLVMAVGLTGAALTVPTASYATSCYTGCSTTAPKDAGGTPASDGASAAATTHVAAQDLAFTGANVMLPASIGGGAVLIGGGLILAGRRRRLSTTQS
jgi:hypothetical protein